MDKTQLSISSSLFNFKRNLTLFAQPMVAFSEQYPLWRTGGVSWFFGEKS